MTSLHGGSLLAPALLLSLAFSFASSGGESVKISLAGDSTVQTYKTGDVIGGWGQFFRLFLKDGCGAENLAVGGRSSKTFIQEGRWDKLLAGKPRFVLIQFGHNDSHGKDRPESTDAAGDYKDWLRKYADDAKNASVVPVFVTPVHRRLFDKDGAPSSELKPYADAMREVAAEKGVFCVDLYEASGKLLNGLGEANSAPFFCKPSDRSHYSPEGAYAIAGLVAEALKAPGSPLKDFVRDVPLPLPASEKSPAPGAKPTPCAVIHVMGVQSKTPLEFAGGSDGVSGAPASWMTENADQRLVVSTQPVTSEWTECHFTFVPKKSGSVLLILMSDMKDGFVCYDDVSLNGAPLENGCFEKPDGWAPLGKPVFDSGSGKAHGGATFAKCASDDRLNRNIQVEAGKPVSMSFWIKSE